MLFGPAPLLAFLALVCEASFGYPQALYRAIGHPVSWIGAWITVLEKFLNRPNWPVLIRRLTGILALLLVLIACAVIAIGLVFAVMSMIGELAGTLVLAVLASTLLAQRSLDEHVAAVAVGLERGGLPAGRAAVSQIVGRDTAALDESGVARAAIESLAENFSDGVVAPLLWLTLGGLPGVVLYKAINTADSMIGHRSDRYREFGWAAARLDDVVNLPASRLSAVWLTLAALCVPDASAGASVRAVWRDAGKHKSPNAGWPEAALAGALAIRIAGPRVYGGRRVEDHWMGDGNPNLTPADIRRALLLYRTACLLQAVPLGLLALGLTWLT